MVFTIVVDQVARMMVLGLIALFGIFTNILGFRKSLSLTPNRCDFVICEGQNFTAILVQVTFDEKAACPPLQPHQEAPAAL